MGTKEDHRWYRGPDPEWLHHLYTYAKDVVVFRIEDDEFNTSSINSVRDSDDAFKAIVKDGEVVALFITENGGKDGGKPDIKSDFKFDSISASREENGTVR